MPLSPEPGDFAAVRMAGNVGKLVELGEWLNGDGFREWGHALVYVGGGQCLQAMPGGSDLVIRGVQPGDIWSTGVIPIPDQARARAGEVAEALTGIPYSWLDYQALIAHRLRIPVPGLQHYIADTFHEICSQLVDTFELRLGIHLYADGRWPGFVTPADLGNLLRSKGAVTVPDPP
jgi:hypothetical protein